MDDETPELDPRTRRAGDASSSRLTADDVIPEERRQEPRRVEDRVRIEALQHRYAFYRRVALQAVTAYAVLATAAIFALFIIGSNNANSSRQSAAAAAKAAHAAANAQAASESAGRAQAAVALIQRSRLVAAEDSCQLLRSIVLAASPRSRQARAHAFLAKEKLKDCSQYGRRVTKAR